MEITIPVAHKAAAIEKLEKLIKKATKYGNTEISYRFGETSTQTIVDQYGHKFDYEAIQITVEGEAPKYGDHKFLARVEILDGQNLIHTVPGQEGDVDQKFRQYEGVCEHCNKIRDRKDIFVFEKDTGEQIAVGRTCLRDYLGIESPTYLIRGMQFFQQLEDYERETVGSYVEPRYPIEHVLALTADEIHKNGWISSAMARESDDPNVCATASIIYNQLTDRKKEWKPSEKGIEVAKGVIEFFRNGTFNNDYMINLQIILEGTHIIFKKLNLVVSAVAAYKRTIEREEKEKVEKVEKDFVGNVGEIVRGVKVVVKKSMFIGTGNWGDRYMYIFDVDGSDAVWFTTQRDIEELDELVIDMKIKEHKNHPRFGKQNIVSHVKVKG